MVCGSGLCSAPGPTRPSLQIKSGERVSSYLMISHHLGLKALIIDPITALACYHAWKEVRHSCNSSPGHQWCPWENLGFFFDCTEVLGPGPERLTQDEPSTAMTFDLYGSEMRQGARKSPTSLSAEGSAFPHLDSHCWEQEPDRTTESWAMSEVRQHRKRMSWTGNVGFLQFSWELTWQSPAHKHLNS